MWKAVLINLKKMLKSYHSVLTTRLPENYNGMSLFTVGGSKANETPLVEGFEA
jgi:hypothetical protein